MACRSFLLAKHDAIPDLNSNYILFHETKMDLSDTSEFLLVIQVLRCLRGYNPPATFSLFFLQGAELPQCPLFKSPISLFHNATSKFGRFLPSLFLDRDFRFDPFTDLGWVPKTSSDVSLHV